MITCVNCAHLNSDGATECEACYTPLPTTKTCPNCQTSAAANAAFCGQCGYAFPLIEPVSTPVPPTLVGGAQVQNLASLDNIPSTEINQLPPPPVPATPPPPAPVMPPPPVEISTANAVPPPISISETAAKPPTAQVNKTQLQQPLAHLLHVQTNTPLELPAHLSVIHMGKPNDLVPPDIDVSGFSDSDIVSRIHADIRVEGDAFYIEDMGSSNGTYINNLPLSPGNRHRLRPGDRIALGKGDKVSFLFQLKVMYHSGD